MGLVVDQTFQSRCIMFIKEYIEADWAEIKKYKSEVFALPALEPLEDKRYVTSGLCQVGRQLIKNTMKLLESKERKRQLESLLGYKMGCLKACAAVSPWTNFCEIEFPNAVQMLLEQFHRKDFPVVIPNEFVKIENELSVPKKLANGWKYFIGKNKGKVAEMHVMDVHETSLVNPLAPFLEALGYKEITMDVTSDDGISSEVLNEQVTVGRSVYSPFLCDLALTLTDLIILSGYVEVISKMPNSSCVKEFLFKFPSSGRWLSRCLSKPKMAEILLKLCRRENLLKAMDCKAYFQIVADTPVVENCVSFVLKPANPKQMHIRINNNIDRILNLLDEKSIRPSVCTDTEVKRLQWNELPSFIDPSEGDLNKQRSTRKRQQIENMATHISKMAKAGDTIVDFCAGGGHLGIVLAYLRPDCHVVLVENKEESIEKALKRIENLNLANMSVQLSNLEYFTGPFNIGISLHACGSATDLVLQKCLRASASFVICPCCYGSVRPASNIKYPKSQNFQHLQESDYYLLARSADRTSADYESDYTKQGKSCMLLVDCDRTFHMEEEKSYQTKIYSMEPLTCSPKNNIIVGSIT